MEERLYDLIFICRPDTPEADVDKIISTLEHAAAEKQTKIEKTEKWGRKRMAYRVHKLREGYYVYMSLRTTHGELVKELERRLKVADPVIKYLTVRLDEELKRQAKLKAHRERRAARRPRKAGTTRRKRTGRRIVLAYRARRIKETNEWQKRLKDHSSPPARVRAQAGLVPAEGPAAGAAPGERGASAATFAGRRSAAFASIRWT
jgi:small subunit ribosomal protein S6